MTLCREEPTRVCPLCKKEYLEAQTYCRSDGAALQPTTAEGVSSRPWLSRDADTGAWTVSGRAEQG